LIGAVALVAAALFVSGPARAATAPGLPDNEAVFSLIGKYGVTPADAVPSSVDPIRFHFRYDAPRETRLVIRVNRLGSGKTIRRIVTRRLRRDRWQHLPWDGRTQRGRLAPMGKYRVLIGRIGGPFFSLGRIRIHGHLFPVDGPHGTRGYIGEFGAPRVDGRTHEGFDITAACGTPLVAVRAGTILKKAFDPELYGNYVVLKGEGERRTYKYSHLIRPAPVRRGQKVRAGRRLGSVGQTGNAAGTPCHLHFEVRSRGRLLDPEPLLESWWSGLSASRAGRSTASPVP
jgi:murein DD-endopeptidase MepM/ murein hydrolase activator NlpD